MQAFASYLLGYLAFFFGAIFFVLNEIKQYKAMADANPDPKVQYNAKAFLNKELINLIQLFLGGIAIVWILPHLAGNGTVDIKSADGTVIFPDLSLKRLLTVVYFFIGYSGNIGLFSLMNNYKKTFVARVGGDPGPDQKP